MDTPKHEYPDKYVSNLSDIPNEVHWAIIKVGSITIPGDERSRTNPGHGYPEHQETTISYEVYFTEEKWKNKISYLESQTGYGRKEYKAIKVQPATIKTKIEVDVK